LFRVACLARPTRSDPGGIKADDDAVLAGIQELNQEIGEELTTQEAIHANKIGLRAMARKSTELEKLFGKLSANKDKQTKP
jgi:hypothetical protein